MRTNEIGCVGVIILAVGIIMGMTTLVEPSPAAPVPPAKAQVTTGQEFEFQIDGSLMTCARAIVDGVECVVCAGPRRGGVSCDWNSALKRPSEKVVPR